MSLHQVGYGEGAEGNNLLRRSPGIAAVLGDMVPRRAPSDKCLVGVWRSKVFTLDVPDLSVQAAREESVQSRSGGLVATQARPAAK